MRMQCQSHIRVTENNSLDFTKLPVAMQSLCKIYRIKKRGAKTPALPDLPVQLPKGQDSQASSAPSTPAEAASSSNNFSCKTSPAPASPVARRPATGSGAGSPADSQAGPLPAIFGPGLFGASRRKQPPPRVAPVEDEEVSEEEEVHFEHNFDLESPLQMPPALSPTSNREEGGSPQMYFDHSLCTVVKLHSSGALTKASMATGPQGFRVATFPDGMQYETEEVNIDEAAAAAIAAKGLVGQAKALAKSKAKAKAAGVQKQPDAQEAQDLDEEDSEEEVPPPQPQQDPGGGDRPAKRAKVTQVATLPAHFGVLMEPESYTSIM